jgi:ribosomal protein L11 methyltransferase
MRSPKLWQVRVTTTAEAEEAAIEILANELGVPASCYTDSETHIAAVSAYLETPPAQPTASLARIRDRLKAAREAGLEIGAGTVELREMKRENWAESWKRHFRPISIGNSLLLKASWSRRTAKAGQKVIVLDPGLSFGTGHHATTSYCLREVIRFCKGARGSFLDIGTGSGILAIAAAKLGCPQIEAFDFDPEAVRVARENAQRNRVAARVKISRGDVTRLSGRAARKYDLVCANLISNLLVAERKRIIARVAPNGTLVLAGILQSEFDSVRGAFESEGMKLIRRRDEKEWASGAFVHNPL